MSDDNELTKEGLSSKLSARSSVKKFFGTLHCDVSGELAISFLRRMKELVNDGTAAYFYMGSAERSEAAMAEGRDQDHHHFILHLNTRAGLDWLTRNIWHRLEQDGVRGGIWWGVQKGTNQQAEAYASKCGTPVADEGTPLSDTKQGKRTDIDIFKAKVEDGDIFDLNSAMVHCPSLVCRSKVFVLDWLDMVRNQSLMPLAPGTTLRVWQKICVEHLRDTEPDDRSVYFHVCKDGNSGKSWLCRRMATLIPGKKVQVLRPGRVQDMAMMIQEDIDIYIIDVPREVTCGDESHLQYRIFEEIKDGYVASHKYNSRVKMLRPAHVVVFMNHPPDRTKLSPDRYVVVNITPEMCVPCEAPFVPTTGPQFSGDEAGDGPTPGKAADYLARFESAVPEGGSEAVLTLTGSEADEQSPSDRHFRRGETWMDVNYPASKYWLSGSHAPRRVPWNKTFRISTSYHEGLAVALRRQGWSGKGKVSADIDLSRWPKPARYWNSKTDMLTGLTVISPDYVDDIGNLYRLRPSIRRLTEHIGARYASVSRGDDRMCFGEAHALQQQYGNRAGNPDPYAGWKAWGNIPAGVSTECDPFDRQLVSKPPEEAVSLYAYVVEQRLDPVDYIKALTVYGEDEQIVGVYSPAQIAKGIPGWND